MISGETVMGVTTNVNEFGKMKLTEKWVWQWVEDTGKGMKRGEKYELQNVCKKKWGKEKKQGRKIQLGNRLHNILPTSQVDNSKWTNEKNCELLKKVCERDCDREISASVFSAGFISCTGNSGIGLKEKVAFLSGHNRWGWWYAKLKEEKKESHWKQKGVRW